MKSVKYSFLLLLSVLMFSSCETLVAVLGQLPAVNAGTTTIDNSAGLKEALSVGITKSVLNLNKENGYFSDEAIKILLPGEAQMLVNNLKLIPGGEALLDQALLRLNRAAEDAATEALPIFSTAIKNITFADAASILFGADTAATSYLRDKTYTQLVSAFRPKINNSLNKNLVGDISATKSWTDLTSAYNKVAQSTGGRIAGLKTINTDLAGYVTSKALDGLFLKVSDEEKQIRKDPVARVTSILKQVFGQLDKK